MGFKLSNLFGGSGSSALAKTVTTTSTATGTVATITRLLGASSTVSLVGGSTNSNLSLSDLSIQAAAALGSGASQTATVRETIGTAGAAGFEAREYAVTISTPADVQTVTSGGQFDFSNAAYSSLLLYA